MEADLERYNAAVKEAIQQLPSAEAFWSKAMREKFPVIAKSLGHILPFPANNVAVESAHAHAGWSCHVADTTFRMLKLRL